MLKKLAKIGTHFWTSHVDSLILLTSFREFFFLCLTFLSQAALASLDRMLWMR